jgi:hypothetical protein
LKKRGLENEIQAKSKILSQQRISGFDAQRINSERMDLRAKVTLAEKDLADLEEQLVAADKTYHQEKELVGLINCDLIVMLLFKLSWRNYSLFNNLFLFANLVG